MRLQVRLVDDVQAVFVTQIEESRVVRVVARANGVDVELFAQSYIRDHVLHRHRAARVWAELVTVHSSEDQALIVESEHAVDDLKTAEAHALAHDLVRVSVRIEKSHAQRVERRVLRRPWANLG